MKHNNDSEKRTNRNPDSREALSDSALEAVTGGVQRRVWNDNVNEADVHSGPGQNYDVESTVPNGDYVNTTGRYRYNDLDGQTWYELTNGGWIAGSLIGY